MKISIESQTVRKRGQKKTKLYVRRCYSFVTNKHLNNPVVPKLFLSAYHLWVPYCYHVPPCTRKSQCAKYNSIKSLEKQNWHICNVNKMTVRNFNGHFYKTAREVVNTKIQEFVNRTRNLLTKKFRNLSSKNYSCECIFCEEKQKVGLFVYHLEGLRVPQFENHCSKAYRKRRAFIEFSNSMCQQHMSFCTS